MRKFPKRNSIKEFTTDENGQNPLSPEEGQKVIDRLGGCHKIYRIKFEAEYLRYLAYEGAKNSMATRFLPMSTSMSTLSCM